jgi:rare lipoprotein A
MLNWNWSYTLSTSVVALAIISSLTSHSAQAQTTPPSEVRDTIASTSASTPLPNTLKVTESRSQLPNKSKDEAIARIHTHKLNGKNAATVYVRGIPVVTYVESDEATKSASETANDLGNDQSKQKSEIKGATKNISGPTGENPEKLLTSSNPIERATATAAMINQLNRDGLDASKIIPAWNNGNYVIKLGDRATLKFDGQAILPESLQTQTENVLESANLLRRLLGGANPVSEVANAPKPKFAPTPTFKPALNNQIVGVMSGMASWYGPGFDGNQSASGEIFNANDLTAAHPSLPFGTLVRVVNMDNGQSVVVRINDRGPYADGRIIDVSAGAADMIGMVASGVAPVRLEILSR